MGCGTSNSIKVNENENNQNYQNNQNNQNQNNQNNQVNINKEEQNNNENTQYNRIIMENKKDNIYLNINSHNIQKENFISINGNSIDIQSQTNFNNMFNQNSILIQNQQNFNNIFNQNPFFNQNQQIFNDMFNQNQFFMQNLQNFQNGFKNNKNEIKNFEININLNNKKINQQKFDNNNNQQTKVNLIEQTNIDNNKQNINNNNQKIDNNKKEVRDLNDSSENSIYNAIIKLKSKYPQGLPWNNNNKYVWGENVAKGLGYSSYSGSGCFAFAMIASDAAFGNNPVYQFNDRNKIRVGDILRINNDTHFVIVLKINGNSKYTIAEGNYNSSINWERIIDLNQTGFDYGYTRYKN